MAPHFLSGFVLIYLCAIHVFVYGGANGGEVQGLKPERSLHQNESNMTTIQTEGLVEKASRRNMPLKPYNASDYHLYGGSSQFTSHWAAYRSLKGEYYGTKASINIYRFPNMETNQASTSTIWVYNFGDGTLGNLNVIQAGWHVNPMLYHDRDAHFFVLWTADGYQKTGCFNLDCPGFIYIQKSILFPGYRFIESSVYGGTQYYITLKIYKDPQTGDWLLFSGMGDAPNFVGYWPKSLFTSLADSTSGIDWGGSGGSSESAKLPPVGSGHFPSEGESRAAAFKFIQYVDNQGNLRDPTSSKWRIVDKVECYDVGPFNKGDGWNFYFGGPGGCT